MSELLRKLGKLYGQAPVQPDQFGRRQALPTEIARMFVDPTTMEEAVDQFLPTDDDIIAKEEGFIARTSAPLKKGQ